MASAELELEYGDVENLARTLKNFGKSAENVINEVFHDYGGNEIEKEIMNLLPKSGRKWRKKKKAASSAQPFTQLNGNLSITVHTKSAYNYLYFPDDGSNTIRHYGNQQFMMRGKDLAAPGIIEKCREIIIQEFEGGE